MNQSFAQSTGRLLLLVAIAACGLAGFYLYVTADSDADEQSLSGGGSENSGLQHEGGNSTNIVEQKLPSSDPLAPQLSKAPPVKLPWKDWPRPALAFVLTCEQEGYFEPCGCTANQLGGMSRRANLVEKLKGAGWDVVGLDVGGLPRRTGAQAGIKLQTSLNALELLDYMAVGLGVAELRLGVDRLLDVQMQMMNDDRKLRFLCANIELLDGALEGFPLKSLIREVGGVRIGVTSVMSEKLHKEVFPVGDAKWSESGPAIAKAMAEFDEQGVELRVLLSQSSVEESIELAKEFPQFNVVLTARGVGDPDPNGQPQKIGETLVVEAGKKGKHVGVLGVYPENGRLQFRYKVVSLERADFEDTQSMVDLMQQYQNRLKNDQIVLVDGVSASHPSQSTFVGADKCGECHTEAYKIWKDTPHAHALESLDPTNKRTGFERLNGVNRTFDPECLACHVTGWDPLEYTRFRSGFLNEEFATNEAEKSLHTLLAGSQCENCHGPGSQHVAMVDAGEDDAGKSVRVTLEQSKSSLCGKCHDGDNSPKFEFDSYWDKVKHYGMD